MKKFIIIFVSLISLSMILAACNMPASTSPQSSNPTAPFPVVTSAAVVHDIVSGTQTAMALQGQGQPTAAATQPQFPAVGATATTGAGANQFPTTAPLNTTAALPTAVPTHLAFPTSTPGIPATYTVQKGETCYCLARRFNVDPQALINANKACSGTLDPGTALNIPSGSTWPSGSERARLAHPTNYTVGSGETIYSIACKFGDADPNLIIAANGLTSPYTLTFGKVIYVP